MDNVQTAFGFLRSKGKKSRKTDYTQKLWRGGNQAAGCVDTAPTCYTPLLNQLGSAARPDTLVFQSVVVTALRTMNRVLGRERQALAAAISLAQGDKLGEMVAASEEAVQTLREMLTAQGARMLTLCPDPALDAADGSWWFALTETIQVLEESSERMVAVVSGQPRGSAERRLSSLVVRLLRRQHHHLLDEAEAWIS